jgi:hypothetical protein
MRTRIACMTSAMAGAMTTATPRALTEAMTRVGARLAVPPVATGPTGPRAVGADAGTATAEYAITTIAAAGFAGLLVVILKSNEVRGLLMGLVRSALSL